MLMHGAAGCWPPASPAARRWQNGRPAWPCREQLCVFLFGLCLRPHAGDAHPAQLTQKDQRRQGVGQAAALADEIAQRPGTLPEGGVHHAVQRFFQILLGGCGSAKDRCAGVPSWAACSASVRSACSIRLPQVVQRPLIIQHHFLRVLRRRAAAEQSRLLGLAARFPPKIPAKPCWASCCAQPASTALSAHTSST